MASQSAPSSPPSPPQSQGMEGEKPDAIEEATKEQLIREDQVQNAVRFLSHPKVRGSPVLYRRSFLEKKGLTTQEIDEAFRRVPDPPPSTASTAQAPVSTSTQVAQQNPSAPLPTPAPQPTAVMAPALVKKTFNWYHIVLASGILAAGGTGTVVFFKRVVFPRIKAWIKRVASEREEEDDKEEKQGSKVAEEAAEAAKAAASAAAIVAKASQDLLSSRSEEKGYFEAFMRALDAQVKEMKSMGEAIKKLENKKENGVLEDQFHHSSIRNGPVSNVWGAQPVNINTNGIATADYGRPASGSGSTEPVNYKSYMEMMSMGPQKSERAHAAKSWEMAPPLPNQRPPYTYAPSHSSDDGSNPEIQESAYGATPAYPNNGAKISTSADPSAEPWWRKKSVVKIGETEGESFEEAKQFSYGLDTGSSQSQVQQRRWVPPQPPPVVMPEAAAAIRQPTVKSNPVLDEGGDGTGGADDVAVKADDAGGSGSGSGSGGRGANESVEERKEVAVEANEEV